MPSSAVLDPREDPVADELVQRHAARARAARLEHPRAEDGIRFAVEQRLDEIGEALRRVLAVSVQERDEIEASLDRPKWKPSFWLPP